MKLFSSLSVCLRATAQRNRGGLSSTRQRAWRWSTSEGEWMWPDREKERECVFFLFLVVECDFDLFVVSLFLFLSSFFAAANRESSRALSPIPATRSFHHIERQKTSFRCFFCQVISEKFQFLPLFFLTAAKTAPSFSPSRRAARAPPRPAPPAASPPSPCPAAPSGPSWSRSHQAPAAPR